MANVGPGAFPRPPQIPLKAPAKPPPSLPPLKDLSNPILPYDNFKTYKTNDLIKANGNVYKLKKFIGAAGYAPVREGPDPHWEIVLQPGVPTTTSAPTLKGMSNSVLPYDNFKTYKTNDLITVKGNTYKLKKFIGAAGYAPVMEGLYSQQLVQLH